MRSRMEEEKQINVFRSRDVVLQGDDMRH